MKFAISRKNIWDKTPRFFKSTAGNLLQWLPTKTLLGKKFQEHEKFVEKAEWWPRPQSIEYQISELKRICTLAGKTPYYNNLFTQYNFNPQKISSPEDISILPTIDKDTVNSNLTDMCSTSIHSPNVDYITTGGTSGIPLRFYIGKNRSSTEYPYLLASWKRIGFQLGMPLAVIRGRTVKPDKKGLHHEYDPILKHHYYSNFHMTDANMGRYLEHISSLGSCFLHVYPSSIANLARYIRRSGFRPPRNIVGILAESENVYPEQRKLVEEVFKARYFASYGHTEKLVAAAECQYSPNYHVWPTYGYFELLDATGAPVTTAGLRGEIVGTGFINSIVPFIRYRTGDFATYVGDKCELCGREHIIISDISGHNVQENLVAADYSLIPWSAINMHDDTFDNIMQYQMYQDTPGQGVLKIVPAPTFSAKDIQLLQRNLGKKFQKRFDFKVIIVDSISLSNRGKAIFIDQHISNIEV